MDTALPGAPDEEATIGDGGVDVLPHAAETRAVALRLRHGGDLGRKGHLVHAHEAGRELAGEAAAHGRLDSDGAPAADLCVLLAAALEGATPTVLGIDEEDKISVGQLTRDGARGSRIHHDRNPRSRPIVEKKIAAGNCKVVRASTGSNFHGSAVSRLPFGSTRRARVYMLHADIDRAAWRHLPRKRPSSIDPHIDADIEQVGAARA